MPSSDELEEAIRSLRHLVDALEAETEKVRLRALVDSKTYSRFPVPGDFGSIMIDKFGGLREINLDSRKIRNCSVKFLAGCLLSTINTAEDSAREKLGNDARRIINRF